MSSVSSNGNCFSVDDDLFDTESFINDLSSMDGAELNSEQFAILDRLCKKNDVVSSIKKVYTSNLSKAKTEEELSHNALVLFVEILIDYAFYYKDPKFINSALKLVDRVSDSDDELKPLKVRIVSFLNSI